MCNSRSIIHSLPISDFNDLIDSFGLEKTWHLVLATHLKQLGRADLDYILQAKEFKNIEFINFDFLDGLSIGEISALYEYSLAYTNRDQRKESGQYFTPDDVAQVMAKKTLGFLKNKIWVDPCCGVGNLSFWLIRCQSDPEQFLLNNMYCVDRERLALLVARFLFTINFQKNELNLFNIIKPKFIQADFLGASSLPKYDYAILNPPYVNVEADARFETAAARDLYAYFLEKIIKTTSGFVSISPQTFTNGQKFNSLRKLLVDNFSTLDVFCFDNVPDNIFRGIKFGSKNSNQANSTRAGIIVARKNVGKQSFRITPLLRWRVKERQELLDSIDNYLVAVHPKEDVFPKLQRDLLPLYDWAQKQHKIMAHLVSNWPTKYRLIVPSTPRYFISALKHEVDRSSFRTLYFHSEAEQNQAYLLLNSSYMYWWWRVNDGGMTISERTLLTLPIMDDALVDKDLLLKIERSEKTNRVTKRNAGKDNENVKHDQSLIAEINRFLFPDFANSLLLLHNNSVI